MLRFKLSITVNRNAGWRLDAATLLNGVSSDPKFVLCAAVKHAPNCPQRCSNLVGSDAQPVGNLLVSVVAAKKTKTNRSLKVCLGTQDFDHDRE
jgi:hypothetical protein